MITMTEIARLTGVSQPTVSRVLNGNTAVNPEIRERVLACAREHDFQPNVMAQSLVGSKTRLIGVIVTDISNSFFAELVKHIGEEARKDGYSLILFSSDYDLEKEKECLDVVKRYRVDGLIMVPVDENGAEWRGMVSRLDIPTVVITRHATGIDSFYVAHDEAGAQVARHLHEQGYEEYIFFGNTTDDKYLGFIDGMANECREFRKHLTIISSKDSQVIEAALKDLRHDEHFDFAIRNDIISSATIFSHVNFSRDVNPRITIIHDPPPDEERKTLEHYYSRALETEFLENNLKRAPLPERPCILDIDLDYFKGEKSIHPQNSSLFMELIQKSAVITISREQDWVRLLNMDFGNRLSGYFEERILQMISGGSCKNR